MSVRDKRTRRYDVAETSNFNITGIPEEAMIQLKREAKRLRTSVNALILKMIKKGLGFSCKKNTYHDLDHLAGSWSAEQEKSFKSNIEQCDRVD
jgi:hypothetical protein